MISKCKNNYNTSEDILTGLIGELNKENIIYATVSNLREYPKIYSDVDFIADDTHEFIEFIVRYCSSNGLLVVNSYTHATGICCHIASLSQNGKFIHFPGPDLLLYPTWRIKSNPGFSFKSALKQRVFDRAGFFKLSTDDMFMFYFIKRVDKQDIGEMQFQYLKELWSHVSPGTKDEIRIKWGQNTYNAISHSIAQETKDNMVENIKFFTQSISQSARPDMRRLGWIPVRLFKRVGMPAGMQVVFMGSDGSGKSTVLGKVMADIEPIFRSYAYFHLFPTAGTGKKKNPPVTDPHGRKPRNLPASIAKLFLWLSRYWTGWLRRVYPAKIKSTAVYFDRYYHDLLVDPKRYRYGGPMWLARLVGRLVPKPDLWILLDAPAEVLQSRKQEVPFEETARQRQAYLDLVKGFKNSVVIDASQSLDDVVADTNRAILEFMAKRTEKRLARYIR